MSELGHGGELPVTVREAIAARIDAMPAEARSTLLSAAVIGKTFWRGLLEAVGGVDDVDSALAVLESRDLVRRDPSSQLSGDVQFTFKHMLIREVAYATVPRATRRERHAAVAGYIEEAIPGETLSAILAYHWREAGEPAQAIPYLLAAAESARRGWAQGAVVDLYSKALELTDDEILRREIRLKRGLALVALSDYPSAVEELGASIPELEAQDRLDALIALGHATLWTEDEVATIATAAQAAPLVEEVGDESAVAAVLAMESQGLAMRGDEGDLGRALELGDRALELWIPGTRALDLAQHLHLHANTTCWAGEYEKSRELSRRTRALADDLHSAESLLRGGGLEALALAGLGKHEEAIAIWDELFEAARELGRDPQVVLNYSALAYRELNDLDEARRRSEEALSRSAAQTFGMPRQFAGSDLLLQTCWPATSAPPRRRGRRSGKVQRKPRGGRPGSSRAGSLRRVPRLRCTRSLPSLQWSGRTALCAIARRTRRRKYESYSLISLGRALEKLGRRDEAVQALRAATTIADELIGQPARWRARVALGRLLYELGDDAAAEVTYGEASELIESFAGRLHPSALRPCALPRRSKRSARWQAGELRAEPPIRFVAVGDVMVDVLCGEPTPAGRVHAQITVRAGGSAVNAAIAASRAGAAATVVGRVGADPSGELVLAALEREDVEAKLARDPDLTTGVAIALGSSVVAHRGANAALGRDDVPDPLDADALLVSGFALFQPGSADAGWAALERFRGTWSAVDVASPGLAEHADVERLARSAGVLLVTNDEARVLTGTDGDAAATQLARRFRVACVKLGEAGAVAAGGRELVRAASRRVEERSPFGAGDAFAAALLVALATNLTLATALERACDAGARAAGEKGRS